MMQLHPPVLPPGGAYLDKPMDSNLSPTVVYPVDERKLESRLTAVLVAYSNQIDCTDIDLNEVWFYSISVAGAAIKKTVWPIDEAPAALMKIFWELRHQAVGKGPNDDSMSAGWEEPKDSSGLPFSDLRPTMPLNAKVDGVPDSTGFIQLDPYPSSPTFLYATETFNKFTKKVSEKRGASEIWTVLKGSHLQKSDFTPFVASIPGDSSLEVKDNLVKFFTIHPGTNAWRSKLSFAAPLKGYFHEYPYTWTGYGSVFEATSAEIIHPLSSKDELVIAPMPIMQWVAAFMGIISSLKEKYDPAEENGIDFSLLPSTSNGLKLSSDYVAALAIAALGVQMLDSAPITTTSATNLFAPMTGKGIVSGGQFSRTSATQESFFELPRYLVEIGRRCHEASTIVVGSTQRVFPCWTVPKDLAKQIWKKYPGLVEQPTIVFDWSTFQQGVNYYQVPPPADMGPWFEFLRRLRIDLVQAHRYLAKGAILDQQKEARHSLVNYFVWTETSAEWLKRLGSDEKDLERSKHLTALLNVVYYARVTSTTRMTPDWYKPALAMPSVIAPAKQIETFEGYVAAHAVPYGMSRYGKVNRPYDILDNISLAFAGTVRRPNDTSSPNALAQFLDSKADYKLGDNVGPVVSSARTLAKDVSRLAGGGDRYDPVIDSSAELLSSVIPTFVKKAIKK